VFFIGNLWILQGLFSLKFSRLHTSCTHNISRKGLATKGASTKEGRKLLLEESSLWALRWPCIRNHCAIVIRVAIWAQEYPGKPFSSLFIPFTFVFRLFWGIIIFYQNNSVKYETKFAARSSLKYHDLCPKTLCDQIRFFNWIIGSTAL